jgi:hypothetical protein
LSLSCSDSAELFFADSGVSDTTASQSWVDSHGYQLVEYDWWAKDRGCMARTPTGEEIVHSEDPANKATGWVWQFAIFAVGTLPAVGMIIYVSIDSRR